MDKRCTNSACRKIFSVNSDKMSCPWCGKVYPRLKGKVRRYRYRSLTLFSYGKEKIKTIKAVRLLNRIGLFDTKVLVERTEKEPISVEIKNKENIDMAFQILRKAEADFRFSSRRVRS